MLSVLAKHWSQNGVPHPAAQGPSRQLRLPVRARLHSAHGKALLQKILTKTLIGQIRSMQWCNSIRTGMLEAKAAKFCSKFPQHLFSVTFQLSQPCYVSPFINVYEVVAITAAIKQTKIANDCLSFSICLYYPLNPPILPYSLPTPSVSQVVTTPRE